MLLWKTWYFTNQNYFEPRHFASDLLSTLVNLTATAACNSLKVCAWWLFKLRVLNLFMSIMKSFSVLLNNLHKYIIVLWQETMGDRDEEIIMKLVQLINILFKFANLIDALQMMIINPSSIEKLNYSGINSY